jgi:hypothetical protein
LRNHVAQRGPPAICHAGHQCPIGPPHPAREGVTMKLITAVVTAPQFERYDEALAGFNLGIELWPDAEEIVAQHSENHEKSSSELVAKS